MMKQFDIDKAIYEKYIVPTKHKTGYMIGIEFEIPILNMSQEKIDFERHSKSSIGFERSI